MYERVNLRFLRDYVADDCVDLVYLDPRFNSNATCNVSWPTKSDSQAAVERKAVRR